MRVHYVLLHVLAVALLSNVDATSTEINNGAQSTRSSITGPNDISTQRFLRTHKTVTEDDDDDEERAIGIGWVDDLIQNNQLKTWAKQEKSANDVISLLKLDKVSDNLLESPQWKAWTSYMTIINKNNVDESMVGALTLRFGADKVSEMLASAAKVPGSSKDIAAKLEAAQIKRWANSLATSDDISKLLKVDKATDGIFDSPQLATYAAYLKAANQKNPSKKTTVLETFTKKYGEEDLLKMLVSGQNTKSAGATKLKDDMVQSWLDFTTPPVKIFKTLKLDQAGDDLLSSPLLSTWVQYMKAFNKEIPRKKTSMIETFGKSYGDGMLATMLQAAKKFPSTEELATNLQRAQFKQWMAEKKTPDVIYKTVLKLDSTSDQSGDIWRMYYKAYDKEFPGQLFSFNP